MFELFVKLIEAILSKLPHIDFSGGRKRGFARSLLHLHAGLRRIVCNGETIVTLLEHHRAGEPVATDQLVGLIAEQESLIDEIVTLLDKGAYHDVLQVKLPQLLPIQFCLVSKKRNLGVWLQLFYGPGPSDPHVSSHLKYEMVENHQPLKPLGPEAIAHARQALGLIQSRNDELRSFLDRSFGVEELL